MIGAANYPLNCGTPTATFVRQFGKRTRPQRSFELAVQQQPRVTVPGTTTQTTTKDRVVNRTAGATVVSDYAVTPQDVAGSTSEKRYTASSDNTAVFAIDPGFVARFVGAGSTVVRVKNSAGETQSVALTGTSATAATKDTFTSWASSSLAKHMTDQVTARFAGKAGITPTTVKMLSVFAGLTSTYDYSYRSSSLINIYSQWPGNTHVVGTGLSVGHQNPDGPYVRSSDHWLAGVDLSCISVWNTGTNGVVRATMVSPEHWVCCKHGWEPSTGNTLRFAAQDGSVSTHTVVGTVNIDGADIRVGRITPAIPAGVSFATVLPKDARDYLPGFSPDAPVPAFKINQDFQALVVGSTTPYASSTRRAWSATPQTLLGDLASLQGFTNDIRYLDSGNPTFVLVNGEAVLVSVHSSVVGGPHFSDDGIGNPSPLPSIYDLVNSAMTTLGGGYQLTDADIDEFTDFSS